MYMEIVHHFIFSRAAKYQHRGWNGIMKIKLIEIWPLKLMKLRTEKFTCLVLELVLYHSKEINSKIFPFLFNEVYVMYVVTVFANLFVNKFVLIT